MIKPSVIEVKRIGILKTLRDWFSDPEIRSLLKNVDPYLLLNGDETEILRRFGKMDKVLIDDEEEDAA